MHRCGFCHRKSGSRDTCDIDLQWKHVTLDIYIYIGRCIVNRDARSTKSKTEAFRCDDYIWSCPLFPVVVAYMKVRDPYLPKLWLLLAKGVVPQTTLTTLITCPPKITIYALFQRCHLLQRKWIIWNRSPIHFHTSKDSTESRCVAQCHNWVVGNSQRLQTCNARCGSRDPGPRDEGPRKQI